MAPTPVQFIISVHEETSMTSFVSWLCGTAWSSAIAQAVSHENPADETDSVFGDIKRWG
jgi:hypothetical protein